MQNLFQRTVVTESFDPVYLAEKFPGPLYKDQI